MFLLVGNRDQNKLRFLSELTVQDLHASIPPLPAGVTGAAKDCRQYLTELAVAQGAVKSAEEVTDDVIALVNTMPNRLRWILDCTMGSVGDFEYRRNELVMLSEGKLSMADIDDDAVVASFYDSVAKEDGFMRQYMLLGQLAVVLDSTLFVHGGVYGVFEKSRGVQSCVGLVPNGDDLADQLFFDDRDEWVGQLNRWMRSQVDSIIARPAYDADRVSRAGQALFLYVRLHIIAPQKNNKCAGTAHTPPHQASSWPACLMTRQCRCPCLKLPLRSSKNGVCLALFAAIRPTAMPQQFLQAMMCRCATPACTSLSISVV